MSLEELRAAVLALPLSERYKLAEEIEAAIDQEEQQQPMPDWLYEECERRRKKLEANPETGIPGDEFFRRLEERYGI